MLANLIALPRYRGLISSLVARELKARYRGSFLGYFWSFLNPVLQLAVYSVVFTQVFQQNWRGVPKETYALFLFCGILPWTWFSTAVMESADVLIENGNLIRKLMFPAEVLPIVRVVANMVHFLLGLPILVGAFLLWRALKIPHAPSLTLYVALLPVVILMQLLLTTGFALALSSLAVHFRDLKNIVGNLLMAGFFASAIIFPFSWAEKPLLRLVLTLNPLAHLMVAYQHVLYFGYPLGWRPFLATAAFSLVTFLLGYGLFDRLRDSFADEV